MAKWDDYYKKQAGRPVRPLFTRALEYLPESGIAIDLGCGSGAETAALARRGWTVHAIDSAPASIEATRALVGDDSRLVNFRQVSFEELSELPTADLVYSFHSLPFCRADRFLDVLTMVRDAVTPGGVLAISLFGPNDDWVRARKVSGIAKSDLLESLKDFEILHFAEQDAVGPTALEGPKHWHTFEPIARLR